MLLRFLVSQFVRQVAEQKLQETVSQVKQSVSEAATEAATKQSSKTRNASERPNSQPHASTSDSEQPPTPVPKVRCEVLFVLADAVESSGLLDLLKETVTTSCASHTEYVGKLPNGRLVGVIESGPGAQKASQATGDAIAFHRPNWLISCGFASSLHEKLRKGHILLANEVTDGKSAHQVGLKVADDEQSHQKGLHFGRLLSVNKIVTSRQEKQLLGEEHNALACDTESSATAAACPETTNVISVRVITDNIDDELPPEMENLLRQKSFAGKMGAAVAAMWKKPSHVKDMWKLRDEAIKASDRLARFLQGVVEQLPVAPHWDSSDAD